MFGSNYGKKRWSPGFSLGYRVGFRRGWNGAHGRFGGSRYGGRSRFAGRRFSVNRG